MGEPSIARCYGEPSIARCYCGRPSPEAGRPCALHDGSRRPERPPVAWAPQAPRLVVRRLAPEPPPAPPVRYVDPPPAAVPVAAVYEPVDSPAATPAVRPRPGPRVRHRAPKGTLGERLAGRQACGCPELPLPPPPKPTPRALVDLGALRATLARVPLYDAGDLARALDELEARRTLDARVTEALALGIDLSASVRVMPAVDVGMAAIARVRDARAKVEAA